MGALITLSILHTHTQMHTHTQAHSLGPLQHFHPTLRVHNRPVCKRAALWSLAHPFAEQSGCSVGRSAVYGAACFTIICCDSVCVCVCVDTECNKSLSRWSRWESRYSGLNEQSRCFTIFVFVFVWSLSQSWSHVTWRERCECLLSFLYLLYAVMLILAHQIFASPWTNGVILKFSFLLL